MLLTFRSPTCVLFILPSIIPILFLSPAPLQGPKEYVSSINSSFWAQLYSSLSHYQCAHIYFPSMEVVDIFHLFIIFPLWIYFILFMFLNFILVGILERMENTYAWPDILNQSIPQQHLKFPKDYMIWSHM